MEVFKGFSNMKTPELKDNQIDVVIPYHEKDKDTVGLCISSCIRNLENLSKIYLVTKDKDSNFSNVITIDEDNLFKDGLSLQYIKDRLNLKKSEIKQRAGWLFQQLIKMGCSYAIPELTDYYVVVDADVVFFKKINFFTDNKMLLTEGKKLHPPFFACFERLVGKINGKIIPFVAHNMIIHKPIMLELLDRIEKRFDKKWFDAILDNIDYSQNSFFSEYQTYGNYLINYHPNRVSIRQLAWSESLKPRAALNILLGRLDYFALHSYKREKNSLSFYFTKQLLKLKT